MWGPNKVREAWRIKTDIEIMVPLILRNVEGIRQIVEQVKLWGKYLTRVYYKSLEKMGVGKS